MKDLLKKDIDNINNYVKSKNITVTIPNIDEIEVELVKNTTEYPFAKIDKNNPNKILISDDIKEEDRYKWLNHELLHVVSGNGVITGKEWHAHKLNEAITEYINQEIIHDKYSDYYDIYINALKEIMNITGEDIILKAYFNNDLNLIINELHTKTNKSKEEILKSIDLLDNIYYNDDIKVKK